MSENKKIVYSVGMRDDYINEMRNNFMPGYQHLKIRGLKPVKVDGYYCCPLCNERLQEEVNKDGRVFLFAKDCSCCEQYEMSKKREEVSRKYCDRIPQKFRGVYLNNLEKPIPFVESFIKNFKTEFQPNAKGLQLYGEKGTGKTYAARCIINELAIREVKVFAISFVDLLNIYSNYKDRQTILDTENKIKHAGLVFLDDFGANQESDFMVEKINSIIDKLYSMKKSIIITTNITRRDFAINQSQDIGRAYDRIIERCHPILMEGESYRVKIARDEKSKFDALLEIDK